MAASYRGALTDRGRDGRHTVIALRRLLGEIPLEQLQAVLETRRDLRGHRHIAAMTDGEFLVWLED